MEVFAVLANSGTDVQKVQDAVILYIARKKQKGRSEQQIQDKLLQLEDKFKHVEVWHSAFRNARALYQLPKSKYIPLPKSGSHNHEPLRPIDIRLSVSSPLNSPASLHYSLPTSSSQGGPPPASQDLPHVLPAFSWTNESLESLVHTALVSPEQIISSDVLSLLSRYSDSEGDDEITAFLSQLEQS